VSIAGRVYRGVSQAVTRELQYAAGKGSFPFIKVAGVAERADTWERPVLEGVGIV